MSTAMELVVVEESNEELKIIELEVHEKLCEIVDSVSKALDKPNERTNALLEKGSDIELKIEPVLSDFKDKLNSTVTEDHDKELVLVQNKCDVPSELQKMLEKRNIEILSSKKELFDTLNLRSKPSTSVLNENKCENIDITTLAFDHGYSLKESQPNKGKKNGDLKIQDIATSLLLGDKRQSKKRKEFGSSNENDANPSNAAKKPRFPRYPQKPTNLSLKCLEPFKKGWKRELVHRKLNVTDTKIQSDIYYFSPSGVKLRSYRDVAEYLKDINETSLSLDCFTYKKILIHHPPEEFERNAGEAGPRATGYRRRRESGMSAKSSSSSNASKSSPKFRKKLPEMLSTKMKKISNINQKLNTNPKKRIKLGSVPCSLNCPGHQGILPSLQCGVCLCMFHPQCVNFAIDITSFTCIKCTYRKHYGKDKSPTEIPHVHATADLRNIDDECESPVAVEVRSSMIANNITVKKIQISPTFHVLPRLTAAPKGSQSILNRTDEIEKRNPPPLKMSPFALSQPIKHIKSEGTWVPPPVPPKTIALNNPPPLKMVTLKLADLKNQTNGSLNVNRLPPPLKAISSPQTRLVMVPITVPSMNSVIRTNGGSAGSVSVLSKNNTSTTSLVPSSSAQSKSVLTSVSGVKSGEQSIQKPGVVTMINNMVINNVPMNNVGTMKFNLKTSNGNVTEVLVPEIKPANATSPPQPKYIVTDKFGKPNGLVVGFGNSIIQLPILNKIESYRHETTGGIISVPMPNPSTSILMPKLIQSAASIERKPEVEEVNKEENSCEQNISKVLESKESTVMEKCNSDDKSNKVDKQDKRAVDPMIRNIQRFFIGPTVLLRVFEYLPHEDLSRVRCVSRSWKWWASQPDLWKSIDLSGTCVYDWDKLAELIKQFKSIRLDMRKMNVFEDQNRTWHCFISVLKDLESIEQIDFGNIPGAFLTPIARGLNRLKVLTAEMIVEYSNNNCRLDIGIFGKLEDLIKLRLKGVPGLQLQNILTEGLSSLANLKHLVHLSITTIRDAPASDFEVIKSLKQLKELELGDCKNWDSKTYGYLTELTELNKLRLEVGTAFPLNFCHSSMSKLNKLTYLELNNYKINANLVPVLKLLPQLEHLNIIPNCNQNSEVTNTIIYEGLQGLKALKVLEWKILTITSSRNSKKDTNCDDDDDSENEVIEIDPKCDSENENVIIKEDDACIPILINGGDKCITIDELWSKVKDICSNVIFH